ncbi:hypothetical protein [Plastoroseomonas arctica]|uniref:Uncharacterized protein n=1 Tax=Plastoroseomonas arctica TaxID=1509237 RepID=A0AAF1KJ35_9PROT|nr:hypothetical protein [Plastoroseomonas arctica]MBR0654585.1 hypothetical protein [Plastoroseomonas arctica]
MDEMQKRFRAEVERQLDSCRLASTLAEWMDAHHSEAAALLGHARMDWAKAAEALGAHGLKDQTGQQPTAETARETWLWVEARRQVGTMLRNARGGER